MSTLAEKLALLRSVGDVPHKYVRGVADAHFPLRFRCAICNGNPLYAAHEEDVFAYDRAHSAAAMEEAHRFENDEVHE